MFYQNDITERRVWLRIEIDLDVEGVEMAPNPKIRYVFFDYDIFCHSFCLKYMQCLRRTMKLTNASLLHIVARRYIFLCYL